MSSLISESDMDLSHHVNTMTQTCPLGLGIRLKLRLVTQTASQNHFSNINQFLNPRKVNQFDRFFCKSRQISL